MTFNVSTLLVGLAVGLPLVGGAFALLVGVHALENARRDPTAVPAWWIAREQRRAAAWLASGTISLIVFVTATWIGTR